MGRLEKVVSLLKREISAIILHKVDDKRIGMVSILNIKISPDLRHAKVFYSTLGDEDTRKQTHFALKDATPYIKGELGKELKLSVVPHIRFIYDDSIDKADTLIQKINSLE